MSDIIGRHGGYENTRTFQLADLIYDVTVRFCEQYVDRRSRTHDQMVQAARSGMQNLLEGSVDSAVSKKSELKLTGIAKGSLAELQRDYRKFLRHRGWSEWPPQHAALQRFRAMRCATLEQFRGWVGAEVRRGDAGETGDTDHTGDTDEHGLTRTDTGGKQAVLVRGSPCGSVSHARRSVVRPCCLSPAERAAICAANGVLSLLNVCIYLVGRQLEAQAAAFAREGGVTERLWRVRHARRG